MIGRTLFVCMVCTALSACAAAPNMPATQSCSGAAPVETSFGGRAAMGVGSDGFISATDVVIATRVTPGNSSCTSVGGSIRN